VAKVEIVQGLCQHFPRGWGVSLFLFWEIAFGASRNSENPELSEAQQEGTDQWGTMMVLY
jgi:hypothetical protein